MPEVAKYAPGTPSWVDLSSPDLEASARFYGELFGWKAEASEEPEARGYTMLQQGGKNVAGMGAAPPGQPPVWMSYVTVEDADATAKRVPEAGGSVFLPPMDVMDVGRMAIFADPAGAMIAVWQPRSHKGADLVNEPNSLCWNELQTRDLAKSTPFYASVFGWTCQAAPGPMTYTECKLGDATIAGMMEMGPEMPAEVPPHWAIYFAVADCEATVAKARALGGTILAEPMQIPPGTMAVIADPHGASFNVLQFAS